MRLNWSCDRFAEVLCSALLSDLGPQDRMNKTKIASGLEHGRRPQSQSSIGSYGGLVIAPGIGLLLGAYEGRCGTVILRMTRDFPLTPRGSFVEPVHFR